jgi:hypothetical protein
VGDVDGDAEAAADYGLTCVTNDFELLTIRRSTGRCELNMKGQWSPIVDETCKKAGAAKK